MFTKSIPLAITLFTTLACKSLHSQIHYTASPTLSLNGKAILFFNGTVDSAMADPGNLANGLDNLEQRVIDAINAAGSSVDVCAYELTSLNIVVAICKAHERGVRVRIIVDDRGAPRNNENLWRITRNLLEKRYKVPFMSDAGWPWVHVKDNFYPGSRAQMHHKFVIVDQLSPDSTDDVVLTGSYNFTITGLVSMQNLLVIRDHRVALQFTQEFEQMWGSSGPMPDSTRAAFHQRKTALPLPSVSWGEHSSVSVHFAPMDFEKKKPNFLHLIADLISREADHDIKICSFSFSTGIEIDDAIREKYESLAGFEVKAVFERSLGKQGWSLFQAMTGQPKSKRPWRKIADAYLAYEDRHLHHKYLLIDAENPDTTDVPIIITGSFNFSHNANEENDENFLVIRDRQLANQFLQEFYARFKKARAHVQTDPAETGGETDDLSDD